VGAVSIASQRGNLAWVIGLGAIALVGAVMGLVGYLMATDEEQRKLKRRLRRT
jgi:hypothetical protein